MRPCPVCESPARTEIFSMSYRIPDGWPLPSEIHWYTCDACEMLYGDGDFNQAMLDEYYLKYYGYGVNNPDNVERLKDDALRMWLRTYEQGKESTVILDFGGAGDDGKSIIAETLSMKSYIKVVCANAGDVLPYPVDVIYASHVIEHIYDLPQTMEKLNGALAPDGLLIIDGPDATGLLLKWKMPILDFNTKHINHFTLRNYLDLGHHHGFELVHLKQYELEGAPAYQLHFRRLDVEKASALHIIRNVDQKIQKLKEIKQPVNIWGLGDITWCLLTSVDLDVLDYIDNDPAYRGQTYNGKSVQERPTNDAPIVIMAQGQRKRLIENIRKAGVKNQIIEI